MSDKEQDYTREAGGDIVFPRREREHGKIYKWFDNFWYHHKWKTIIIAFFLIVFVVCTVQMCTRDSNKDDITVVCAGPYGFATNGDGLQNLKNLLAYQLPLDVNGDGDKQVGVVSFPYYSKEKIQELEAKIAELDAAYQNACLQYGVSSEEAKQLQSEITALGDPTLLAAANAENYQNFYQSLQAGQFAVAFLDPALHAELMRQGSCLIDLTQAFGVTPENGVYYDLPDGRRVCYGLRLGDSALYQNNAMRVLPEDTVLCLVGTTFFGNEKIYEDGRIFFEALLAQNG